MEIQEDVRRLLDNGGSKADRLRCASCSQKIDCSDIPPFTGFVCPACGVELVVPVSFGDYQLCTILHKSRKALTFPAFPDIIS